MLEEKIKQFNDKNVGYREKTDESPWWWPY